jgi:hypothetical protein
MYILHLKIRLFENLVEAEEASSINHGAVAANARALLFSKGSPD